MTTTPTTRYGAPRTPVVSAAGILRGKAAAAGTVLADATDVDLAAAAVAVDALLALTGATSLERPSRLGAPAVAVLAAALARAAGHGTTPEPVPVDDCPSTDWVLALADEHIAWVRQLVPADDVTAVLDRVAWDAWAAGEGTVFAAYATLLAVAGS